MRTKVTKNGVLIPKALLEGIDEVDIQKAQNMPSVTVIDVSVTKTMGRGEHSDASAAPVVERARGCRARRAGGRDGGGSGGRTVYPPTYHPRGGPEGAEDTAG